MPEQLEGLIDIAALERFLGAYLPPQEGELSVEKHEAGYSNETFYVSWGPTGDPPEPEPKGSNHITAQPGFRSREEPLLATKRRQGAG
jgi:hypothetical protein